MHVVALPYDPRGPFLYQPDNQYPGPVPPPMPMMQPIPYPTLPFPAPPNGTRMSLPPPHHQPPYYALVPAEFTCAYPGPMPFHPLPQGPFPTHAIPPTISPPPPFHSPARTFAKSEVVSQWSPVSTTASIAPSTSSSATLTNPPSDAPTEKKARHSRSRKVVTHTRLPIGPMTKKLHDYRNTQDVVWQLKDISGHVAGFCFDQYGSRFVQDALSTASKGSIEMVFQEIVSCSVYEVSTNVFGNYVIQRLLEHGTEKHKSAIFDLLIDQTYQLSIHVYGCRVVQRLLDLVAPEQQGAILTKLEPHVSECATNAHGNHVIQKVLEVVPPGLITFLEGFRGKVIKFAQHSYGCRVIQRCLEYLPSSQAQPILDEFMVDADAMLTDQFGNYIVQYLLKNGNQREKDFLLTFIRGRVVKLSMHKYASNVCEVALENSSMQIQHELIDEMLVLDGHFPIAIRDMIHDQYGNYVLQKALVLVSTVQKRVLFEIVEQQVRVAWMNGPSEAVRKHLQAIQRVLKKLLPTFLSPHDDH